MWPTRSLEPATDGRKADGAKWTALRTPKPPNLNGKEACVQVFSSTVKDMLKTLLKILLTTSSNTASWVEGKQGAVRSRYMYISLGMASELHSNKRASCARKYWTLSSRIIKEFIFFEIESSIEEPIGKPKGWHDPWKSHENQKQLPRNCPKLMNLDKSPLI